MTKITNMISRIAIEVLEVIIVLAILGMVAVVAFGTPRANAQTATYLDARSGSGSDCAPGYYGEQWPGSVFREAFRTDNGWHAYAFCKNKDGKPTFEYRTCVHGECLSMGAAYHIVGDLLSSAVGKDRAATVQAWIKLNPSSYHCGISAPGQPPAGPVALIPAPDTVRGRGCAELKAAMHKDWPLTTTVPVVTWAVKVNGTASTRPAYELVNGIRGTKEVARATVGQLCNALRPALVSGNDLWAEFGPNYVAGRVALCAKK